MDVGQERSKDAPNIVVSLEVVFKDNEAQQDVRLDDLTRIEVKWRKGCPERGRPFLFRCLFFCGCFPRRFFNKSAYFV